MSMVDLGISISFIVGCCCLAQVARKVADQFFSEGIVPVLLYEAIAAGELCSCCFELIIVADNFGVASYAVVLFILSVWWSKVWGTASACPYTHMEEFVEGKMTFREMGLRTWAALMGGCCVYRLVQVFWWLEIADTHKGRAFEECSADLHVDPYLGAAIEGFATLMYRLVSKTLSERDVQYGPILDSLVGTSLVVAAFNYSGGYFNPVLATALKWGCTGHTNLEHIIVYWIGACAGALLSVPLFQMKPIRDALLGLKEKIE